LADNLKVGDVVEAAYNLRGREWTDPKGVVKYFNTLEIWSMQYGSAARQPSQAPAEKRHPSGLSGDIATSHFDSMVDQEYADDDLPF
jgi:hypothetical protein